MPRVFSDADFADAPASPSRRVFTDADFADTTPAINPVTERPNPSLLSGEADIEPGWSKADRIAQYTAEDAARKQAVEDAARTASLVPAGGIIAPSRGQTKPTLKGSDVAPLLRRGLVTGILQPAEQAVSLAAPLRGQPRFATPASDAEAARLSEGLSEAAKDPQTFWQKLAVTTLESAPSTLPLLAGGGLLKGAGAGGKVLKLALAAGEGAQAGQQNALQVAQEIRQAPIEVLKQSPQWEEAYAASPEYLSEPEREQLTREAMALHRGLVVGGVTAPITAMFSHLTQAGALGRVLEPNLAQSRLRRLAGAVGSEMIQEAPQSGSEALSADLGAAPARPDQTPGSIAQDVAEQSALGALSAAAIAAPLGGAAAIPRTRRGLVNPEAAAEAQQQQPPPALPPDSQTISLPVSDPAEAGPDPAAVAEIAAHPSLEGYPDEVRVKYAETVLTQGVDAGKAFMEQVDSEEAMLASQEQYPARKPLPETELRADQRYRQYRDAGYSDLEAMQFVDQDRIDDVRGEDAAQPKTLPSPEASTGGQPVRSNVAPEQTGRPAGRSGVGEVATSETLDNERAQRGKPPSHKTWSEFDSWLGEKSDDEILNTLLEQSKGLQRVKSSVEAFGKTGMNKGADQWTRISIGSVYREAIRRGLKVPRIPELDRYVGAKLESTPETKPPKLMTPEERKQRVIERQNEIANYRETERRNAFLKEGWDGPTVTKIDSERDKMRAELGQELESLSHNELVDMLSPSELDQMLKETDDDRGDGPSVSNPYNKPVLDEIRDRVQAMNRRAKSGKPVSSAAVDTYGIKLPEGYVREGDRYVFKPPQQNVSQPTKQGERNGQAERPAEAPRERPAEAPSPAQAGTEGASRPAAPAPAPETQPQGIGRDREEVPPGPVGAGRPGGPVQQGEGGRGAEGGSVPGVTPPGKGAEPASAPKPYADRISAKLDELAILGGVSRDIAEEQFRMFKDGKTDEDAEAGLDKTIARLRPKNDTFKGVSTTKRVAALTDEEFAKIVEPDSSAMRERNVELGAYEGDSRFEAPVQGLEGAVHTDFSAVREYLKTGALSEQGKQVETIARNVKEKMGKDAPPTGLYKTAGHILRAVKTGRYNDIMHPDNKASRDVFTELTGVSLPKTVKETKKVFTGKPFPMKTETALSPQMKPFSAMDDWHKAHSDLNPAQDYTELNRTVVALMNESDAGKLDKIKKQGGAIAQRWGFTPDSWTSTEFRNKLKYMADKAAPVATPEPAGIAKIKEAVKRKNDAPAATPVQMTPSAFISSVNDRAELQKIADGTSYPVYTKAVQDEARRKLEKMTETSTTPSPAGITKIKDAVKRKKKGVVLNNPPPGGWKESDKVPKEYTVEGRRERRVALSERAQKSGYTSTSQDSNAFMSILLKKTEGGEPSTRDLDTAEAMLKAWENRTPAINETRPEPVPPPEVKSPVANLSDTDAARLKAIQDKIRAKLRGQVNMGMDPELLTLAGEMAVLYAKGGVKTFRQFAAKVKADMADAWDGLKTYLHSAWQAAGATDQTLDDVSRADAKAVVEGMDTPAENEKERTGKAFDNAETGQPFEAVLYRGRGYPDQTRGEWWAANSDFADFYGSPVKDLPPMIRQTIGQKVRVENPLVVKRRIDAMRELKVDPAIPNEYPVEDAAIAAAARAAGYDSLILQEDDGFNLNSEPVLVVYDKPRGPDAWRSTPVPATPDSTVIRALIQSDESGQVKALKVRGMADKAGVTLKVMQERVEAEVVKMAHELVTNKNDPPRLIFAKLVTLYKKQPTLSARTSTSIEQQAYSTPAPMSFALGYILGVTPQTPIYDPTGGNGMLLIGGDIANSEANELNPDRAKALEDLGVGTVTERDATDYVPKSRFPVVKTNPPFGSVPSTNYNGFKISKLEHIIALKALEAMEDNGKAAIILGAKMQEGETGRGAQWIFENYLYGRYNVVGNFEIEGDLYSKQGASWPVRVLIVNGRRTVPLTGSLAPKSVDRLKTWDDTWSRAEGLRREIEANRPNLDAEGSTGISDDNGGITPPERQGDVPVDTSDASGTTGVGSQSGGIGRPKQPASKQPRTRSPKLPAGNASSGPKMPVSPPSQSDVGGKPDARLENGDKGSDGSPTGQPGRSPVGGGKPDSGVVSQPPSVTGNEFQVPYVSRSQAPVFGTLMPKNIADGIHAALDALAARVGPIDDYVSDRLNIPVSRLREVLAAEQVDGVALAIDQVERGGALIIGDQTGIGKGRQGAALIRYAIVQGKVPIFFTKDPKLFSDMYGDLLDIGTTVKPLIFGAPEKASIVSSDGNVIHKAPGKTSQDRIMQAILEKGFENSGYDSVFVTYSQVNKDNNRQAFLETLSKLDDVVLILDEAHEAAGDSTSSMQAAFISGGVVERKQKGNPAPLRINKPGLLRSAGTQRGRGGVLYMSATYAKKPSNMVVYFRTDLSRAAQSFHQVVSAIERGGVALQQAVSEALAKVGQYLRRERDFSGVTYDMKNVQVDDKDALVEQVDDVADILSQIVSFSHEVKDAIQQTGTGATGTALSQNAIDVTDFAAIVHNQVGQLLLAAKADAVVAEAVAAHKRGEKPVIALMNTMESFLSQYTDEKGIRPGQRIKLAWPELLKYALSRTLRASEKLPTGEEVIRTFTPSELGLQDEYDAIVAAADAITTKFPVSPIDYIIQKSRSAGVNVGELTGRESGIDYTNFDTNEGTYKVFKKANKNTLVNSFNSGKLDGLLLNASGSTGLSIHASKRYADQKPRHMLIAQAALDINIFIQTLGRILRTGMVPGGAKYSHMVLPLQAEMRPATVAAKKMKSLNANTTAEADNAIKIEAEDFLNKYGDEIVAEYLEQHEPLQLSLDLTLDYRNDGTIDVKPDLARKFTGRMALMPDADQEAAYAEIIPAYRERIAQLKATGEYNLEIVVHDDWDGVKLSDDVLAPGTDESSIFTASVKMQRWEVKDNRHVPTGEEMLTEFNKNTGGSEKLEADWDKFQRQVNDKFDAEEAKLQRDRDAENDEAKKARLTNKISHLAEQRQRWDATRDRVHRIVMRGGQVIEASNGETGEVHDGMLTAVKFPSLSGAGIYVSPSSFKFKFMTNSPGGVIHTTASSISDDKWSISPSMKETSDLSGDRGNNRFTRFFITGNPIAAYVATGGRGQMVRFSARSGEIVTGLQMPLNWNPKQLTNDPRLDLVSGKAVSTFLTQHSEVGYRNYIAVEASNLVTIQKTNTYSDSYTVSTSSARSTGGRLYLDEPLRKITGDFTKRGNRMIAEIQEDKIAKAADRIMAILSTRFRPQGDVETLLPKVQASNGKAGPKYSRMEPTEKGQVTDDNAEGERTTIPDGQAGLWRDELSRIRDQGTRYDQERLAQVQIDEEATEDADFQAAYQVAKGQGVELIPVSEADFGGVAIGDTILISTDTEQWGAYQNTLDHELFHIRVTRGDSEALAAVDAAASDAEGMSDYIDMLDRQSPNWHDEMFADARRRLGPEATADQLEDDVVRQVAEELAADRAPAVSAGATNQDAEYMAAVERGDTDTAQRMVDEAAKRAGYNVGPVWHGSDREQAFSEFNVPAYFGPEGEAYQAGRYVRKFYLRINNPAMGWSSFDWQREISKQSKTKTWQKKYDGWKLDRGNWVATDPSQIKSADPVTRDDQGNVIPLSQRFNPKSQDIRYRRLPPKQFPGISQADLDAINAKVAAMTKLERVKAVAQAKAKLATFRKGPAKAETIRGVVGAAETAGEKEVRDAAALLRAALRPQEKTVKGKALDRLDIIYAALNAVQDDVDAEKTAEAKANVARAGLAARLFPKSLENRRLLAQYRPVRLLKALVEKAEKRIRIAKVHAIRKAMTRYSAMNANQRSSAYMNLTNEGRDAMNRWLDMANLVSSLDEVPTVEPKLTSDVTLDANNNLVNGAGDVVGRYDDTFGYTLTRPEYVDLQTLYETLNQIEGEAGAVQKERQTQIARKAAADASLVMDDIKDAGKLPDYDETAADRMESGRLPKEKASIVRGRATKFRSIMSMLGYGSHLWSLVESVRKGDSLAKGAVVKSRQELESLLKGLGIDRETEHSWRTTRRPVKLPGMRIPVGFTNAELIDLYNQLQDPGSRAILLQSGAVMGTKDKLAADNRKAEDNRVLFRQIERTVRGDPKLLKVAESMQEIVSRYGQDANQVSRYFRGADEFVNEFYWPRSVERRAQIASDDDQVNAARNAIAANLKNLGLAKRRVRHGNPLRVRDAFSVFDEHMGEISRYTHLTIPANELLNAFTAEIRRNDTGPDATTAMRQFQLAYGDQYRGYISNGIRAIMAGEVEKPDSALLRAINKVGRRISGSTLALSASAILQNRYGGMANMGAWLRNRLPDAKIAADFLRIASLPQSLRGPEVKALMENGYLADRWSGQSLRLALMGGQSETSNWRMAREFEAWTDKLNRPLVAREMANSVAAYKALTQNGFTSQEAVDLIEQANRDTQNSTSELDKSQMAREVQQIFSSWFPFTSQGLVQWDFYVDTLRQAKREGWSATDSRRIATATAAVLNLFLLSMLISAMMRLFRKDDPVEEPAALAVEAAAQALEQRIPPVRLATEAVTASLAGRRAGPINMVERTLADSMNALSRIIRGKGNYQDAISLGTTAGKAAGIPVGGLSQYLKILLAQFGAETEGMKDRREDRFFKSEMEDLPETIPSETLNAMADQMYFKAQGEDIIPAGYSKADFRARVRGRYKGTVVGTKKKLSEY